MRHGLGLWLVTFWLAAPLGGGRAEAIPPSTASLTPPVSQQITGGVSAAVSRQITGSRWVYRVRRGDTLWRIEQRFDVDYRTVALLNHLHGSRLMPGERLVLSTRHVVPASSLANGLVVDESTCLLYQIRKGLAFAWHPVALGMPWDATRGGGGGGTSPDPRRWQTPAGDYKIVDKVSDPAWIVPKSIRKLMAHPEKRVPPGPDNPLGHWWMGLDHAGIGVHATNDPTSIGGYVSHGCIRLSPRAAARVFAETTAGSPVQVVYQPVKVAEVGTAIYLEVDPDVYRKGIDASAVAKALLSQVAHPELLDPEAVKEAIAQHLGIAERVSITGRCLLLWPGFSRMNGGK